MAAVSAVSQSFSGTALAVALVAGLSGFFLSQALCGTKSSCSETETKVEGPDESCKLVLVVRKDLEMGTGKIGAQCGHATLGCYQPLSKTAEGRAILAKWEQEGQPKIVLAVKSESQLRKLEKNAQAANVNCYLVHDAGRTQVAPGSVTVLGVGPGPKSQVDAITGSLSLLP